MGVNLALGFLATYLVKHETILRKLKNLNLSLVKKFDDHKLDTEETSELIDEIKDLIYTKEDEIEDIERNN